MVKIYLCLSSILKALKREWFILLRTQFKFLLIFRCKNVVHRFLDLFVDEDDENNEEVDDETLLERFHDFRKMIHNEDKATNDTNTVNEIITKANENIDANNNNEDMDDEESNVDNNQIITERRYVSFNEIN